MIGTLAVLAWIPPIIGHPFMRNAFLAGTGIAACCGAVGYFVVLRSCRARGVCRPSGALGAFNSK